jgi:branched-subunit amino acid transport protein
MPELTSSQITTVILAMAVINFGLRFVPLAILSRLELPKPLTHWLSFIPISVMGALVATEVLRPGNEWQPPLTNMGIYAAALTMVVFHFTRSFLGATLAGMVSFVALSALIG